LQVSKANAAEPGKKPASTTPELLNPGAVAKVDSGAEADESTGAQSDDDVAASPLGKKFAQIKYGDYRTSHQFISENPSLLTEKETDGLLVEGFNAQLDGRDEYARQCVHQALLLQYCRQLGRDGVNLFFKRITTPGHQANKLFTDDVGSTYARIRSRSQEILAERAANPGSSEGVEQIQLHAVDPGTQINIVIPPPTAQAQNDEERAARATFESFPPGLQRALESKSLDEVNKVLGKMSVDEAEDVVAKLSEGGMLSVEEGVIDATTEEGQAAMREIEQAGKVNKGPEGQVLSEDPPLD
jgi:cell division cycle protein 37